MKNLELQIADLQSATQDAEAAAEKIERQRRALEADLQVCLPSACIFSSPSPFLLPLPPVPNHLLQDVQEKLDEEQKSRVKFQKQFAKTDEELRQAKLKIDDLTTATSDQYVAIKRLQEENSTQHRELEALDEKTAQWNRLRKQVWGKKRVRGDRKHRTELYSFYCSFYFNILISFKQADVQLGDLKAQLDEAIAGKMKIEKQKRELEGKVEDLETVAEGHSTKVFSPPPSFSSSSHLLPSSFSVSYCMFLMFD